MHAFELQFLNALTLVALLGLVALGLAITFGLMGIINLAHGEFVMIGAYVVSLLAGLGVPVVVGILLAPVVVAAVGMVVEETVIQQLYERPLDTLLATWGVSLVLRQVMKILFGAKQRGVDPLFNGSVTMFGVTYPTYRLFVIAVAIVVGAAFLLLFFRSGFGVRLRAVIENRTIADAVGIHVRRVDRMAFALGAGVAGLAGAVVAPLATINPSMGLTWLIKGFLVVIVGGEAAAGVAAGSTFIGGSDSVLSYFFSAVDAQILLLVLAIVLLRFVPSGLVRERR